MFKGSTLVACKTDCSQGFRDWPNAGSSKGNINIPDEKNFVIIYNLPGCRLAKPCGAILPKLLSRISSSSPCPIKKKSSSTPSNFNFNFTDNGVENHDLIELTFFFRTSRPDHVVYNDKASEVKAATDIGPSVKSIITVSRYCLHSRPFPSSVAACYLSCTMIF